MFQMFFSCESIVLRILFFLIPFIVKTLLSFLSFRLFVRIAIILMGRRFFKIPASSINNGLLNFGFIILVTRNNIKVIHKQNILLRACICTLTMLLTLFYMISFHWLAQIFVLASIRLSRNIVFGLNKRTEIIV